LNGILALAPALSLRLVLALVGGMVCAQQFAALPATPAILLLFTAALVLALSRLSLPAAFLFGLAWALAQATVRSLDALPPELERRDIIVEGVVLNVPDALDRGLRFSFHADTVLAPAGVALPHRIRLSWMQAAAQVKAGQRWRLRVRLKRPHGFFNPGGMDYELWLFAQGIRASGYVREDTDNQKLAEASPFAPSAWRQALYDRLTQTLAGSAMVGIVTALTMGAENAISPAQWEVFRRTGTAHLVAISGSHISLVAGLVFWFTHRLCAGLGLMRWSPPTVAALAAILAAWAYTGLADFVIPAQRALIMIIVVMAGIASRRNLRPQSALALALLAVVLYDPLAVLSVGFWLSYGAVAVILLVVIGRLRPGGFWSELWKINWATSLGLAPLLLFFFQQVSLVSPLANLLAVPTMGVVLTPLCLFGALLLVVHPPAGVAVLHLAETLLQWAWIVLQWLSDLPWAQWKHPSPPAWTMPLALLGGLLLLAPRGIPARWLGIVLLIPCLSIKPEPPAAGHFRLTLLDVGQGLAATVQTQTHTLVFDTGARFGKTFDTGAAVIEPFLRQQGVDSIDKLIVSHGDNDHIGGAATLLQQFPVAETLSSVPERLTTAHATGCHAGQSWDWDGVRFDLLSPFGTLGSGNDNSCVLRVSTPAGSALLTGDIERAAEQQLIEHYGEQLKTDILIAPHHGSLTSSSPAFLNRVQPSQVLIPVGYLNRYNFPNPEVLRRYRAIGAEILDSAKHGAISGEPGSFPPQGYRQTDGHYWNDR
jgi:competence protein ComEC